MPAGTYHPLSWHMRDIYYGDKGLLGFFTGVYPTLIRGVLINATKLGTYDTIKHKIIDNGILEDGHLCKFVSTVWAGLAMVIVTSPMDNIKTRIMN